MTSNLKGPNNGGGRVPKTNETRASGSWETLAETNAAASQPISDRALRPDVPFGALIRNPPPAATRGDHKLQLVRVYDTCSAVLLGGEKMVFDRSRSRGSIFHDALGGRDYIDCFSFFASQPLGHNHPDLDDPDFERRLLWAAKYKPANSSLYTEELAQGIAAFRTILPPRYRKNLFFISGGSAAVENALKAAMDAKVRENLEAGRGEKGTRILHFRNASHGRGGYALSLTNTDVRKVEYFAKLDWPRVSAPSRRFPETGDTLAVTLQQETRSIEEIRRLATEDPHSIAALIVEPIQGEGGDNHFRPEFLRTVREVCTELGIYLIVDEIQCGMGITGGWWVSERHGTDPDVIVFGKKSQVCGMAARDDFREDKASVFNVPDRIRSTWGGNIVDYVRMAHTIDIIKKRNYLENVLRQGEALQRGLLALHQAHPEMVSNPRGQGLFCAFDAPDTQQRNRLLHNLREHGREQNRPGVYLMPRGPVSVGFRPFLDIDAATVEYVLKAIDDVLTHFVRQSAARESVS